MDIQYRAKDEDEWRWCANVADDKAQEFVRRKNEIFDHGDWRIALKD